jgi:hypothetical protein
LSFLKIIWIRIILFKHRIDDAKTPGIAGSDSEYDALLLAISRLGFFGRISLVKGKEHFGLWEDEPLGRMRLIYQIDYRFLGISDRLKGRNAVSG